MRDADVGLRVLRVFFLPESGFSTDSLTVSAQPPCAIARFSIMCARWKSQTLAAVPLFGHTKILHTLIGVGSTALAAVVPYLGKVTQIFHKGQWSSQENSNSWLGNESVLNCPHPTVVILLLFCASSCCACCTCVLLSPADQRGCRCVELSSPGCSDAFIMPCQWLSCCTCVLLSPADQRGAESGAAGKPRGSPQCFSETSLQCLCLSREFLPLPSLIAARATGGPPHFPHHAHHCSLLAFRDTYIIIHLLMFYCRESL